MEIEFASGADRDIYSYDNKSRADWRDMVHYRLADEATAADAEAVALAAWRVLGGRDAGRVDLKLDERGRPQFLEANPLAGLVPGGSDLTLLCGLLDIPYERLIAAIVDSARERVAAPEAGEARSSTARASHS
jgi:D-alanine-D-alanine ligase